MSEQNSFFSGAMKPGRNRSEDHWHDLVTAVVAIEGSRPLRPPAAMFTEIERKLGLVPARPGWLRVPIVPRGLAAALVFALGWLAWRANPPGEHGEMVAPSGSGVVNAGQINTTLTDTMVALSPRSAAPGSAASSGAISGATTAKNAASSQSTSGGFASSQDTRRTGIDTAFVAPSARGTSGAVEAVASFSDTTLHAGAASRLAPGKETIDLRSDHYVAGMIAAAMQNPVSANPYEAIVQPEEWSDWVSGYELGSEIPPADALALGASWKWSDPGTLSLISGLPGDVAGAVESSASAIPGEDPTQGAVSRASGGNATAQGLVE